MLKKALKILAFVLGGFLLLVVLALVGVWLFVDLDKLANDQVAQAKPGLEEQLGRKVEIGRVSMRLLPVLGGRVEKIVIAPDPTRPEDDRPLVSVDAVGFDLKLWRAIVTLGRDIDIGAIYVDGLKASVVRYKDGRLSFQDIVDRQPAEPPPPPGQADEPLSPEAKEYARAVSIDEIRLKDAEIRLADHGTPGGQVAESVVRKLNVRMRDVRLSDPVKVEIDAAVFAQDTNFRFELSVGPLPESLELAGAPPLNVLRLQADKIDLSRLAPYLAGSAPADLDSALLSSDWKMTSKDRVFDVDGFFEIANLQFRNGRPFTVRLDSKARVDEPAGEAKLEKIDLALGEARLTIAGALHDLKKSPRFEKVVVRSANLDPALLLSYYPEGRASLPPGTRLAGPVKLDFTLDGDANRQTVKGEASLADVDVFYPDTLVKPKGVPMGISVDADLGADDAVVRRVGLVLDELDLGLSGTVKGFADPQLDLKLQARPFRLDRLARLLPSVAQGLEEAKATAAGSGSMDGHVRGTQRSLDAALRVALLGMKLDVPGTKLDGDLVLDAAVKGDPEKDLAATLKLDGDRALIRVEGTVDKAAGTPLRADLDVVRKGGRVDIRKGALAFAELSLSVAGFLDLDKGVTALQVDMPKLDLERFARTVTAIPPEYAKRGFVDARIAVDGDPNRLETMSVALAPLDVRLGRSDLRGEVRVKDLNAPKAAVNLTSRLLDLDELSGSAPSSTESEEAAAAPAKDDPSLRDYAFTGRIEAKKIVVSKVELTDFKGDVRLADGVLTLADCKLRAFEGDIDASGTEAAIWKGRMPFKANLEIRGIDAGQALAKLTRHGGTLQGKADLSVKVAGDGTETKHLEEKLTGGISFGLREGRYAGASLTRAVLGDFAALDQIPGVATSKVAQTLAADNTLRNLRADLDVKNGRMTLTRPVSFTVDGNRVQLSGAVGIAGALFLQGDYFVPAATVGTLTGGRCKAESELRVPVSIGGTATAPSFRPDGKAVVGALLGPCLKDAAGRVLGDKAAQTVGAGSAAEAEAKARAEAERLKAEAEQRARQEAEKRKKEAADKAGNLLRGLIR